MWRLSAAFSGAFILLRMRSSQASIAFSNPLTPFALVVLATEYTVPLSVDNNGNVKSVEERDYFLDEVSTVCSWLLNGKPQPIDDNTIESVKSYLAGVF